MGTYKQKKSNMFYVKCQGNEQEDAPVFGVHKFVQI